MSVNMKIKNKEIDFKSLLIGFLLATVVFLSLGAYSGGTQDVRIVGISTSNKLPVSIEQVASYAGFPTVPVKLEAVNSSVEVPVEIKDIGYSVEMKVKVVDQPIRVEQR